MNLRDQVIEFHKAFGVPILPTPTVPSDDRIRLRVELLLEETLEFIRAAGYAICSQDRHGELRALRAFDLVRIDDPDLVGMVDGLGDIQVVAQGSSLEFGVDDAPVLAEIFRSNMSKLGADGKPIYRDDGKVLKGPNYSPPDILGELKKQGYQP